LRGRAAEPASPYGLFGEEKNIDPLRAGVIICGLFAEFGPEVVDKGLSANRFRVAGRDDWLV